MVRLHSFLALNKHQSSNSLASCQPNTNTNTSWWRSATYWSPSPASHDLLWHHITDRIHMLEKHSVHNTQFLSWNVNVHNLLKSVSNGQYQDREWIFGRSGKTTEFGKRLRPSSPLSISEFEDKNFVYQKNYRHWRKSWRQCDISDFETSDWKRWVGGWGGTTEAGEREEATTKCLKNFSNNNLLSLYISASAFPASPWAYSGNQPLAPTPGTPTPS